MNEQTRLRGAGRQCEVSGEGALVHSARIGVNTGRHINGNAALTRRTYIAADGHDLRDGAYKRQSLPDA